MKLSIWQQFSSNHSNAFVVIGIFETATDAHFAYLHVRRVLRRIIQAHQTNPPAQQPIPGDDYNRKQPSDAERRIFGAYDITPSHLADWTTYPAVDENTVNDAVTHLDTHVIIADPVTGWAGADPFDRLLAQFTEDVIQTEETQPAEILTDITCDAPDTKTADMIYQHLNAHHTQIDRIYLKSGSQLRQVDTNTNLAAVPWLLYQNGVYNAALQSQVAIEAKYLAHQRWKQQLNQLKHDYQHAARWKRPDIQTQIDELVASEPPALTEDEQTVRIDMIRSTLLYQRQVGTIEQADRRIHCEGLRFGESGFGRAVAAIVAWMRDRGCRVTYRFYRTQSMRGSDE
jgi:hypothetical protein